MQLNIDIDKGSTQRVLRDGPLRDSLMLKLIHFFHKRIFLRLEIVHTSHQLIVPRLFLYQERFTSQIQVEVLNFQSRSISQFYEKHLIKAYICLVHLDDQLGFQCISIEGISRLLLLAFSFMNYFIVWMAKSLSIYELFYHVDGQILIRQATSLA